MNKILKMEWNYGKYLGIKSSYITIKLIMIFNSSICYILCMEFLVSIMYNYCTIAFFLHDLRFR